MHVLPGFTKALVKAVYLCLSQGFHESLQNLYTYTCLEDFYQNPYKTLLCLFYMVLRTHL